MVEIEIGGLRAIARGWEWVQGDDTLLKILRQDLSIMPKHEYSPFPALTLANAAIERYGGEIIRQEPPEYTEGRVY